MIVLLLHICIALSSIVYTTFTYISPSRNRLHASYGLIALTIASGTYLVVSTHAPMLSACTTGLIYLCVVSIGVVAARFKLIAQEQEL